MKKKYGRTIMIVLLMLFSAIAYAQDINFFYDRNGNRTSVRIIVVKETQDTLTDTALLSHTGNQFYHDLKKVKFKVSPNPTLEKITIHVENLKKDEILCCSLFSGKGELLKSEDLDYFGKTIDLSHLSCGIYYLKIEFYNVSETWKIIKQ